MVCIHFREAKSFLTGVKMLPVRMRKNQVNKKMQQIYTKNRQPRLFFFPQKDPWGGTHVKRDINNHEPKVAPVVFVENVKAGREVRVRRPHAAELAVARRVWVGDVSACDGDVPIHILRASLSERGIQAHKLDGRASDVLVADSCKVKWLLRIEARWGVSYVPCPRMPSMRYVYGERRYLEREADQLERDMHSRDDVLTSTSTNGAA
jgi:hypothetical protein